jgi:predicted DsbA family dithiol-disulfide isomerase
VRVGATLEQVLTDYPKDVRVVCKMHPLPMHPNAMICAQGALAAHAQGKFHEMSEKLFVEAPKLTRDKLIDIAKGLGLDVEKFTKDLDSADVKAAIEADTKQAMGVGASGTPASFINGRFLNGAAPIANFKKLIDEELAKVTASK